MLVAVRDRLALAARRIRPSSLEPFPSREMWDLIRAWASLGIPLREAFRMAEWGVAPVAGGAVESGQVVLQNVPVAPYEINPPMFFAGTEPNFYQITNFAFSADVQWTPVALPQVGIYGKIVLQFDGTVTIGVANATTTDKWPYGLLDSVAFTANGQDDLYSCQGLALKAHEIARHPYDNSTGDDEVGPGIGSGGTLAVGTVDLRLTWEIPLEFDPSSVIGGVFAQSKALSLLLKGRDAAIAQIATAGGGGTVTIAGTWYVGLKTYQVPVAQDGKLIFPDIRLLHGFNELVKPFSSVGDVEVPLIRVNGSLQRLLVQMVQKSTAAPNFYEPIDEATLTRYRLRFGGNKVPWDFNPAQFLVSQNVRDYGRTLPYHYVALDFARHNPVRDSINLAGITEAYWISTLASGATAPDNGQARVVEETLFA